MNKQEETILEYLENSYSGAKMNGAVETEIRIARAIAAFKADPGEDEKCVFTDKFIDNQWKL